MSYVDGLADNTACRESQAEELSLPRWREDCPRHEELFGSLGRLDFVVRKGRVLAGSLGGVNLLQAVVPHADPPRLRPHRELVGADLRRRPDLRVLRQVQHRPALHRVRHRMLESSY
jgi:hypothetical protein